MPPDDGVPDGYVAVGRVLGAWGIKGDFKIEPLGPDNLFRKGSEVQLSGEPHAIERSRRTGRLVYLKLAGIDDRDIAAAFRGHHLQADQLEAEVLPLAGVGQFSFRDEEVLTPECGCDVAVVDAGELQVDEPARPP